MEAPRLPYADRRAAGRALAAAIAAMAVEEPGFGEALRDAVVLALPRGGAVVGREVAAALGCPMDLVLVRKIGAPRHPELAAAVFAGETPETGLLVRNEGVIEIFGASEDWLAAAARDAAALNARRAAQWLAGRARPKREGRTLIVVDDGLATGTTARAALRLLRRDAPRLLVLAVPVGAPDAAEALAAEADLVVCPARPEPFGAVGRFYERFGDTGDAEVAEALAATLPPQPTPT